MLNKKINLMVFLFFVTFVLANGFVLASSQTATGKLLGFVYKTDKKTPLDEAKVVLVNAKDGSRFESNITEDDGAYKIENLPDGNYSVFIEIKDKEFKIKKLDFIVKIKDGKPSYLSFAINKRSAPFYLIPVGVALAYGAGTQLFTPDPPASPAIR